MILYLTSRLISSVGAFLYPGYASYKVLSQRPAPEQELERWLMYWSVLGCIIGVEYVAEWLISWVPFYYTTKTLFLLYLALPQTQGASYLYITHLHPFFHAHETQIDATLADLKAHLYAFIQERVRAFWDAISSTVLMGGAQFAPVTGPAQTGATPTMADPASGPAQLLSGLWSSYGPGVVASGAALLRQVTGPAVRQQQQQMRHGGGGLTTPTGSTLRGAGAPGVTQSVLERRRQLEEELANLPKDDSSAGVPGVSSIPMHAGSRVSSYSGLDSSELRDRRGSPSGRFEEVEVPSDGEGYDVGDSEIPGAAGRTSWFGWGGSASSKGYERLKGE